MRLRRIARCISSSVGTGAPFFAGNERGRSACFLKQNVERRHVIVPFDQRRDRAESCDGLPVKRPDLLADPGTVIVNPERAAVREASNAVTGEVDFPDNIDWQ